MIWVIIGCVAVVVLFAASRGRGDHGSGEAGHDVMYRYEGQNWQESRYYDNPDFPEYGVADAFPGAEIRVTEHDE